VNQEYSVGDIIIIGNKAHMITEVKLNSKGKVEYWCEYDVYTEEQLDYVDEEQWDGNVLMLVKGKPISIKAVA
jgi:hypothetical protein